MLKNHRPRCANRLMSWGPASLCGRLELCQFRLPTRTGSSLEPAAKRAPLTKRSERRVRDRERRRGRPAYGLARIIQDRADSRNLVRRILRKAENELLLRSEAEISRSQSFRIALRFWADNLSTRMTPRIFHGKGLEGCHSALIIKRRIAAPSSLFKVIPVEKDQDRHLVRPIPSLGKLRVAEPWRTRGKLSAQRRRRLDALWSKYPQALVCRCCSA
jgi:hypothetical protein